MKIRTHHRELYREVEGPRRVGYAISVIRTGAAAAANVNPKPIINLQMNIQPESSKNTEKKRYIDEKRTHLAPMNIPTE